MCCRTKNSSSTIEDTGHDQDATGDVQGELDKKKPAQARRRIVQGGGCLLQVMRARKLDEAIAQVLPLQEDEHDEYRGDAGSLLELYERRFDVQIETADAETVLRAWQ